jgi:hypothetical protein
LFAWSCGNLIDTFRSEVGELIADIFGSSDEEEFEVWLVDSLFLVQLLR